MGEPSPFKKGDLVRVDWPTSRMHEETGKVLDVRDEGTWWTVLVASDQFPHLDPLWYGDRALKPLDGCNDLAPHKGEGSPHE